MLRSALLVGTFLCLWITGFFGEQVQYLLALVLIFSFGLLHGANDIQILRRLRPGSDSYRWNRQLLLLYILFVCGVGLLFGWLPGLALLSFILLSAYHFGEQHWAGRLGGQTGFRPHLLYTSYGLGILFLLFAFHPEESAEVMMEISGWPVGQALFAPVAVGWLFLFLAMAVWCFPWRAWRQFLLFELFLLGVFAVVFSKASLLWSFAIYFVLWHAIPSLSDQVRLLYGKVNRVNGIRYLKASALYWLASLSTLIMVLLIFRDNTYGFMPIFFSFLAAITFPHVLTMSGLLRR